MKAAVLLLALAACEPAWGVSVRVNHPNRAPIDNATLAVACTEGHYEMGAMAVRTTPAGRAQVGGMGHMFPVGCDVFVAKPGYHTQRIRYHDLCPNGPDNCDRLFAFDLVLEPVQQ
jgi:hypothetical protein